MRKPMHEPIPGGVWQDCWGNTVEVKAVTKAPPSRRKVRFEVIHAADDERRVMENRIEVLPYRVFVNRVTGFQCMSLTGSARRPNFP